VLLGLVGFLLYILGSTFIFFCGLCIIYACVTGHGKIGEWYNKEKDYL